MKNPVLARITYDGEEYYFASFKRPFFYDLKSSILRIFNLKNLTNRFGSWHPDPRHFEWRPAYMHRCPSVVKAENEQINEEILATFFTILIGGMIVILIFALAI